MSAFLDFTKQFNRIRQHVAVRAGTAHGVTSSKDPTVTVASVPAVNAPKVAQSRTTHERTADQLEKLSKFNSRLAKIDVPYRLGAGPNPKGPSAHANMKDKADRATNEQVLDPRTRIILFKMIGRGLVQEINGCVSTGKEVRYLSLQILLSPSHPSAGKRLPRIDS